MTARSHIARREIARLAAAAGFRPIGADREAAAFEHDAASALQRLYVTKTAIDLETTTADTTAPLCSILRANPNARALLAAALAAAP